MKLIRIDPPNEEARLIWGTFLDLASELDSSDWVLVGGLMVQLHAIEMGQTTRPTTDVDLLGNSRTRPSATTRIAQVLDRVGSLIDTSSQREALGLRWNANGVPIDVLAPDGLKSRAKTTGQLETLSIPGGTQALKRSEDVEVAMDGRKSVVVHRPDLLGAILLKARALMKSRNKFESDREDFIRLLTLVSDPRALATESHLRKTEQRWLQKSKSRADLQDKGLLRQFSQDELTSAEQTLDLLIAY